MNFCAWRQNTNPLASFRLQKSCDSLAPAPQNSDPCREPSRPVYDVDGVVRSVIFLRFWCIQVATLLPSRRYEFPHSPRQQDCMYDVVESRRVAFAVYRSSESRARCSHGRFVGVKSRGKVVLCRPAEKASMQDFRPANV